MKDQPNPPEVRKSENKLFWEANQQTKSLYSVSASSTLDSRLSEVPGSELANPQRDGELFFGDQKSESKKSISVKCILESIHIDASNLDLSEAKLESHVLRYKGDQNTESIFFTFKSFILIVKFAVKSCPVPLSYTFLFHKRNQLKLHEFGDEDDGDFNLGSD